jgi:hypothetical protein
MARFYVYILFSPTLNRYYIGHTGQLSGLLFLRTNSAAEYIKAANDWKSSNPRLSQIVQKQGRKIYQKQKAVFHF